MNLSTVLQPLQVSVLTSDKTQQQSKGKLQTYGKSTIEHNFISIIFNIVVLTEHTKSPGPGTI